MEKKDETREIRNELYLYLFRKYKIDLKAKKDRTVIKDILFRHDQALMKYVNSIEKAKGCIKTHIDLVEKKDKKTSPKQNVKLGIYDIPKEIKY